MNKEELVPSRPLVGESFAGSSPAPTTRVASIIDRRSIHSLTAGKVPALLSKNTFKPIKTMATTKRKKRILFVWGTDRRGTISERTINNPYRAVDSARYSSKETAGRMARHRRANSQDYEYIIRYEKPLDKKPKSKQKSK